MKKLSFIIAALLVCGTLFAQQPSKTTLSCDPPENFWGECRYTDDGFGNMLSWQYPNQEFWYHYDEEPMSGSANVTKWGIRISPDNFDNHLNLSKVMFYRTGCTEHGGNITVNVYYGGETSPDLMVHITNRHIDQGPDEWVEIQFISYLELSDEPVWIFLETSDIPNAAAYCPTSGNPDGRWAGDYYSGYYDYYAENGIGGDWMIRAFFEDYSKKDNEIDHFNLYRGESLDEMELVAEPEKYSCSFFDTLLVAMGSYYYRLTASYDDGCESAYALNRDNPENDYVHINVTAVDEHEGNDVVVYPNPTNDKVTIEGIEISEIEVYNTLGQLVKTVQGTNEISVAGLPEGVYVLRIINDKGNAFTERVSVGR